MYMRVGMRVRALGVCMWACACACGVCVWHMCVVAYMCRVYISLENGSVPITTRSTHHIPRRAVHYRRRRS